jgi:hypothetical protein
MNNITKIEDIYPMTIVHMRHGKFAIVQCSCDADCVISLEGNEEWQYYPHRFMKEEWEHINYGIGETVNQAFEDFKNRLKKQNENE